MALSLGRYQEGTKRTAIYGESIDEILRSPYKDETLKLLLRLEYLSDGLTGEAGEVASQVKKAVRDDFGVFTVSRQDAMFKECGDVLWYISQICNEMNWKMEDVMDYNLTKLADRQQRDKLQGSGDDR